jgi:hypothetical protein
MQYTRKSCPLICLGIVAILFTATGGGYGAESLSKISELGLDAGDPVKIESKIMSVNPEKNSMTIAEKEVRFVNVTFGGRHFATITLDLQGNPAPFGSFKPGQLVLVEGYSNAEGYIAASKIQKISSISPEKKGNKTMLKQYVKPKRIVGRPALANEQ